MKKENGSSRKCLIISGGDFSETDIKAGEYSLVIACDKGFLNASRLGIRPDLVIGDFDSCTEEVREIPVIKLPVMKDDTDTLSAVRYALKEGCRDITICCAFGGRFDHSFANLQTAAFIAEKGGRAHLMGTDTDAYVFSNDTISLEKKAGCTLSVFSLTERCEGVSISGTLYPLDHAVLTGTFPIGVSNSWSDSAATITVEKGTLLIIISKDN